MDRDSVLKIFADNGWSPDEFGDLLIEQEDKTCMVLSFYDTYIHITRLGVDATPIDTNYFGISSIAFGRTSFTIHTEIGVGFTVYALYALELSDWLKKGLDR